MLVGRISLNISPVGVLKVGMGVGGFWVDAASYGTALMVDMTSVRGVNVGCDVIGVDVH